YAQLGKYQEALDEIGKGERKVSVPSPLLVSEKGYALARAGRRADAMAQLGALSKMSTTMFVDPYLVAAVYAGLGDAEHVTAELARAVELRSGFLTSLAPEPKWDPFRNDAAFKTIAAKVGIQ